MLLGVLFTRLKTKYRQQRARIHQASKERGEVFFTLAGFPTLAPMTFHLLASYSLMAANNAALFTVRI